MNNKRRCMLTVDVEALPERALRDHVDRLIYGCIDGEEWGIGRMMDIADKHQVKLTFFLDFAETELYGDKITEAGKYIVSRGHDLQIHCHYNFLEKKVLEQFPKADKSYYTWCEDENISEFMVGHCLREYYKCTEKPPVTFRGGEYRVGGALLGKLKEEGFAADASYHFMRPLRKPVNRQFIFENGLLELPVGILPERRGEAARPLNFNEKSLHPQSESDIEKCLQEYEALLEAFYDYYGEDALASLVMHSWSFGYEKAYAKQTGRYDKPNPYAAELFDRMLTYFADKIDFITAPQAVQGKSCFTKTVDFDAAFASCEQREGKSKLEHVENFIRKKAAGRKVVIWGKGWIEGKVMRARNLDQLLDVRFYISRDADKVDIWRGKPVKTFEEAKISPEEYYVFLMANTCFPEIRTSLREAGFSEFKDYYDIAKLLREEEESYGQKRPVCSICGGDTFVLYSSERPRRCENCGSVERNRTIPALFKDNLKVNFTTEKILHISPIRSEKIFFKQAGANNITSLDVRPQVKPDVVADLCNMPEVETESFDIVFANCVLNHVYDDEAALSEIYRVLRNGGSFITWVTGSGTMKTRIADNPTGWYGKEAMETYRVGTYRYYGETDFTAQLQKHFAKVHCYEKYDAPSGLPCCWYVCEK